MSYVCRHATNLRIALDAKFGTLGLQLGVEVGAFKGKTSAHLLECFPKLFMWLVDPFRAYSGDGSELMGSPFRQQAYMDNAKRIAKKQVRRFHRSKFLVMTSREAAEGLNGVRQFDFVFIDAGHRFQDVRDDIAAWWPLVRSGGALVGHDYKRSRRRGIIRAVNEFVKREGLDLRLLESSLWWVEKD